MTKTLTRDKADDLLDLMNSLAEDENSNGELSYGEGPVHGRFTATVDGRRVTLYLDKRED